MSETTPTQKILFLAANPKGTTPLRLDEEVRDIEAGLQRSQFKLNGCYSAVQAEAIARHIPYVIGMNRAIGDRAAIEFSVGFYNALAAGREIEFAYRSGCAAIRMEGIEEHLTPVLLTGPERQSEREAELEAESDPPPTSRYSEIDSPFIVGPPITNPRQFYRKSQVSKVRIVGTNCVRPGQACTSADWAMLY